MQILFRRLRRMVVDDRSGFSVVEMLIVFAVVGIAMIPMAAIQFSSRREISEADRFGRATEIAVSRLEQVKLAGFSETPADTTAVDDYTVLTTVAPDSTNPFLREISVQVTWPTPDGVRDVRVATMQSALR